MANLIEFQAIWTPAGNKIPATSQSFHAFISFDNFSYRDQRSYGMWAHGSNKHIHFLSSQHTPPRGEFILWLGLKPRGRREDGAYCVTYSRFISLCLVFLLSRLPACCCKLWVTSFSLNRAVQIRTVNACDAIRKQVFNTHLKQKEKERKKRKKRASRVEKIWAWAQQTERCISIKAKNTEEICQPRTAPFCFCLCLSFVRTDLRNGHWGEETSLFSDSFVWCVASFK